MEADLQRFYGIDYADRWRFRDGRRCLTLRRVFVLFRHLPPDAACADLARDGKPHWSVEAHLLDQLRMSLTGTKQQPAKPHPDRPTGRRRAPTKERARKLADAKRRAAARRAREST